MNKYKRLFSSDNARSSAIKKNIIAGVGIKGCSVISTLLLVPVTINYISSELYGIWLTLSSIVQWISFFDVGFGNGMRNKLTTAIAKNDYNLGKSYVSTTYVIVTAIFTLIGLCAFVFTPYVNWSGFLNVSTQYQETLVGVMQVVILSFCIQIVLKLLQNVIQAFQMNALASCFDMLGNFVALIAILCMSYTLAPDLKYIALAFSVAPLLVYIIASLILYNTKFKQVSPSLNFYSSKYVKELFNLGGEFFVIQIAGIVLYQMINILLSRLCGPEQVTVYNIAYKYFGVAQMGLNIMLAPLLSAFTDAFAKNDYSWMSQIYKKLKKVYLGLSAILIAMMFISPIAYSLWVGDSVQVPFLVSMLVCIYYVIALWCNITTCIINGLGKVRLQLWICLAMMFTFLPLANILGGSLGINGVLTAMIIINTPSFFLQKVQVDRLLEKRAKGLWNK